MRRHFMIPVCCVLALALGGAAFAVEYDEAGNDTSTGFVPPPDPGGTYRLVPDPPSAGCEDAMLQTDATATRSGGGSGTYGPENANDGIWGPGGATPSCCSAPCFHWISAGQYPSGAWFQLQWPAPVEICQIWVDTKQLPSECGANTNRILGAADVQTWDGGTWVNHATIRGQTNDWGYSFPDCVTTDRLRLYNLGPDTSDFQASNPVLYELKVYGCGGGGPTPGDCDLTPIEAKLDVLEPKADDMAVEVAAIRAELADVKAEIVDIPCAVIRMLSELPKAASLPTTHPCYLSESAKMALPPGPRRR